MAATGNLVFIGDATGVLYQWDTGSGETMVVPTAKKAIQKILLAPAGSETAGQQAGKAQGRMLLSYADGSLAVWHLGAKRKLSLALTAEANTLGPGSVHRVHWSPLPPPLGQGSVAACLLSHGAVALVDISSRSTSARTPATRARALRRSLAAGASSSADDVSLPTDSAAPKPPPPARDLLIDFDNAAARTSSGSAGSNHDRRKRQPTLAAGPRCRSAACLPPARAALLQLIMQVRFVISLAVVMNTTVWACPSGGCSVVLCPGAQKLSMPIVSA